MVLPALRSFVVLSLVGCATTRSAPSVPVAAPPPSDAQVETLAFDIVEGDIHNYFFRRGPVAAHVLASSGAAPRLLYAFPAGNAGIGVWFEKPSAPVKLELEGALEPIERADGLRGVSAVVRSDAGRLTVEASVLGSIRTLRDYVFLRTVPPTVVQTMEVGPPLVLRRTCADGAHRMELTLEPLEGTRVLVEGGKVVLAAAPGAPLRVRAVALQDDEPLTPIPTTGLLTERSEALRDLRALAFLSYEEKLLAGSWRFLTYFGRDTLLSTRLLMPALRPAVIEAALGSVLERLAPDGDVAHEEDIGDFATLRHRAEGTRAAHPREPIYDYKMVDDDFLLAPVLAEYLLDTPAGRERAAAFLARKTTSGETFAQALRKNLALVLRRAEPFAQSREPGKLVALREEITVGQWRDSNEGLGYGRYAFDVNAALVPAALEAAARLYASPLLGGESAAAQRAREMSKAWEGVEDLFKVEVPLDVAAGRVTAYAKEVGLDAAPALAALAGPVVFRALSLEASGRAVPVMHSDDGFVLLFGRPSAAYLEEVAGRLVRPFPVGLTTPVGVVVANPAFAADEKTRALFGRERYHGTVVWSWQQAMLAVGLERQLARTDLPAATVSALRAAQVELWRVILANAEQRTGELWTWEPKNGHIELVPFGQGSGHHDESNAAQLWSTVYLAVKPPKDLQMAERQAGGSRLEAGGRSDSE